MPVGRFALKLDAKEEMTEKTTSQRSNATSATSAAEGGHENCQAFTCNICTSPAKDPVVSFCGHLFCWPCLHRTIENEPVKSTSSQSFNKSSGGKALKSISCPVCQKPIDAEQIVPLYGRGSDSVNDSRKTIAPPRPKGRNQPMNYAHIGTTTDMVLAAWFIFLLILWYLFS